MKLRKLLDFPEPLGDFMAFVPGKGRQQTYPSTVAYMAALLLHRYAMLGILDEHGYPQHVTGLLESPHGGKAPLMKGAKCPECGKTGIVPMVP